METNNSLSHTHAYARAHDPKLTAALRDHPLIVYSYIQTLQCVFKNSSVGRKALRRHIVPCCDSVVILNNHLITAMSVACRSLTLQPEQNHGVDRETHLAQRAARGKALCLFVCRCLLGESGISACGKPLFCFFPVLFGKRAGGLSAPSASPVFN